MDFRFADINDAELLAKLRVEMRKERETAALTVAEDVFLQSNIDYFREALASNMYCGSERFNIFKPAVSSS